MITFEPMTKQELKLGATCNGGIEMRSCNERARWFELEDGWHILSELCNNCKQEVETYVNNQIQERKDNEKRPAVA